MGGTVKVAEEIRAVLEFCQSLGFERLPITVRRKSRIGEGNRPGAPQSRKTLTSGQKAAALKDLREEIGDCRRCKLSKGRTNIVFGEGSQDAALMFIGEAPGREEDIQARPFVGDAGKLLTRLIEKMGLRREDVYIGNIVKCRPPLNRDPEDDEIGTCLQFIRRQLEIISPEVIVSLGRISAQTLIGTKTPISRLRGKFYEYNGIPLMATFHPAYLLRNPKEKWSVWEDAMRVMERLEEVSRKREAL